MITGTAASGRWSPCREEHQLMFGPLVYLFAGVLAVYFGLLDFLIQTN